MEFILKIIINILILFNINIYQLDNNYQNFESTNFNNYVVSSEHEDISILRRALHEINKTINFLLSDSSENIDTPGGIVNIANKPGGLAVSKIIFTFMVMMSIFLFVYNMLVGGKGGGQQLAALLPMFGMTIFMWFILYGYSGVSADGGISNPPREILCGTSSSSDVIYGETLTPNDQAVKYHDGFIRLSHDVVKWATSSLKYTSEVRITVTHDLKECVKITRGADIIDDPWRLMDIQDSISGKLNDMGNLVKTVWEIEEERTSVTEITSYFNLYSKYAALNLLIFIANAVVFICFAAISLVLFLNLVFLKLIGIVAMFMLPMILVEPLKSYAQQGLGSIMTFAVKFLTYVILMSMLLSFIGFYKTYTDEAIGKELTRMTTAPVYGSNDNLILKKVVRCVSEWQDREVVIRNKAAIEARRQASGGSILAVTSVINFNALQNVGGILRNQILIPPTASNPNIDKITNITEDGGTYGRRSSTRVEGKQNDSWLAKCADDAWGIDKTVGLYFFFEFMLIIVVYSYMLLIIPGKVAQVFGGNIAFGDGQVTGLASKLLASSPMMGLAAAQTLNAGLISPAVSQLGGALAGRTLGKLNDKEAKEGGLSGEDLLKRKQAEIRRGAQKGFFEEAGEGLKGLNTKTATAIVGTLGIGGLAEAAHAKRLNLGKTLESDAKVAGPGSDAAKAHAAFVDKYEKPAKVFGSANLTEEEKAAAQLSPQQAAKIDADRAATKANLRRYQAGAFEAKGSKQGGAPQKSTLFDKIEPSPQQVAASKAAASQSNPAPAPTNDDINRAIGEDGELVKVSDMTPEQKEAYDKENAVRGALDK